MVTTPPPLPGAPVGQHSRRRQRDACVQLCEEKTMRYSETLLSFEDHDGSHPTEDDLEEFVFGRLRDGALDEIEEHLLICEGCRRRLTETENFVASTRAAARKMLGAPPPTPKPRRFSAPAWALAGAFAVAVVALSVAVIPKDQATQVVELMAERGASQGTAAAGRPLDLRLEAAGLNAKWLELVDAQGSRLHSGEVSVSNGSVRRTVPALAAGQVWIRLYTQPPPFPDTPPLREFGLAVR